jgi:hypothetical protein
MRRVWRWLSSGLLRRVIWAIAVMMEAASTSETSVNYYQTTRRNSPKDSHLDIGSFLLLVPFIRHSTIEFCLCLYINYSNEFLYLWYSIHGRVNKLRAPVPDSVLLMFIYIRSDPQSIMKSILHMRCIIRGMFIVMYTACIPTSPCQIMKPITKISLHRPLLDQIVVDFNT